MQSWSMAVVITLLMLGSEFARSMDLIAVEYADDLETVVSDHEAKNILVFDAQGTPRLNLLPDDNPKHKALIDLLKPGLYVDRPAIRDEIAGLLARFPAQCQATGKLAVAVEPLDNINVCVPGATDNRRVTQLLFTGCVEPEPKACAYDLSNDGGCDFEIGGLKTFLNACNDALHEAVRSTSMGALP